MASCLNISSSCSHHNFSALVHQDWMSACRDLFGDAVASSEGEKVTCRATCLLRNLGYQEGHGTHACQAILFTTLGELVHAKQVYSTMPFYTHLISKNGEVYKKYIRIPSVVPPKGVLFSS